MDMESTFWMRSNEQLKDRLESSPWAVLAAL